MTEAKKVENEPRPVDPNYPMILDLITAVGRDPKTFDSELVAQMVQTCLKFAVDQHTTPQLKLVLRALKEMRYAYRIFNQYTGGHKVSIFGSARTPEDHPDYLAAKEFGEQMADAGWMCITGAANGIMKAGHEGHKPESSFGLSIRLAFESTSNTVIQGDPKLITFRYFFTRKLMFMNHSEAIAVFPGGFGTLDELFEILTLMQTGKSNLIPVVLLEGENGQFWHNWQEYMRKNGLETGWISPEDQYLYYAAPDVKSGVEHILRFYHCYNSSRYIKDKLVIRLNYRLPDSFIDYLNEKYKRIIREGKIEQVDILPEEKELSELPRIVFEFTRRDFGILRQMIDEINNVK